MDNGAPSEITERGEVKRDMRALEVIPVVRTLSGQAVCAELDRTAEHSESFRRPPTLSSAPSPSFSSSVFFVGLAAIGGRKSSLVRPSLDGRCSRGRDAKEGREEGSSWVGWPPPPPPSLSPSFTSPSTTARRDSVLRQLEPYPSRQWHALPSFMVIS